MAKKKKKVISKGKVEKRNTSSSSKSKIKKKVFKEPLAVKSKLLIAALLAILSMAIYAPSYDFDFVYDDDAVVKDNLYVHKGLDGLGDIWSTSYFRGFNENMNVNAFRPVPLSSFAIEYEAFGLSASTNHIFQIIYYGLTGFFLFLFLATLLRNFHPILPIMASLLFLLHPLHVEVVANIKSRDELLAFMNFCLAAWLLLKYVDREKIWALVLSLLFYALAIFSKESAVPTLAIIPAMLYFFRDIDWKKIGLLTLFYVAIIGIFLLYRMDVVGANPIDPKYFDNSLLATDGIANRISSTIMVLGHYLFKSVAPYELLSDYSYSTLPNVTFGSYKVWLSLAVYGALLFLMIRGIREKKVHAFAIFYYFATVSIFSSILFPGFSVYNDRFLYNPVLGICLLISWGIYQLNKTEQDGERIKGVLPFIKANILPIAIIAVISGLAIFRSETRLPDWKDRYVLFEKDAQKAQNNARMRKNYGGSLARMALQYQKSDPQKMQEYANAAITELEAGLKIYPNQASGQVHLGNMHFLQKDYKKAEEVYKKALSFDRNNHHAKISLSNIYYRTGKTQEAIDILEKMSKTHFTQNDYLLLYLSYQKNGDNANAQRYRAAAGK